MLMTTTDNDNVKKMVYVLGTQDTVVKCMKRKTNVVVTNDNCDKAKQNIQTVPCNKQPCEPA